MSNRRHPRRRPLPLAASAAAAIAAIVLALISAPAAQAAPETLQVSTLVKTEKVGLADGRFQLAPADSPVPGAVSVGEANSTAISSVSPIGLAQVFTYRIVLQGTPTDYWVRGTVTVEESSFDESLETYQDCTIFDGDPDAGGTSPSSDVPYSCDTSGATSDATATFVVRDNIQAEVLGVIKPVGTVSMDSGYFDLSTIHAVPGSATIAPPYTAGFDAILRPGDITTTPNTARGVFAYRIVDGGVPTKFWVSGMAENEDATEFDHTSTCDIYDVNPIPTLLSDNPAKPASVSPYSCDMSGTDLDGRGSWQVTFTVSARTLHVVTGTYDQARLINRLCTTSLDNCGVDRATTTLTYADPVDASGGINNPYDTPILQQLKATHSTSVTTTVGVSLSTEVGIGQLFKVTATASLSVAIANTYTYEQTAAINVLPHTTGWWAMSTQMVHAVGDVIVRDGSTYFLLPNITADFPVTGGLSVLTPRSKPYTAPIGAEEPPATGGGSTPATGGGSTPAAQPGSPAPVADPAAAAHRDGLAETGTTVDATPILIAVIAVLLGAALLIARRRTARR